MTKTFYLIVALTLLGQSSFSQEEMYFDILGSDQTGITFTNTLVENDTFNYLAFQYMYNGGGVAIGDINNDGLSDIYFTGNQVSDKLYLNKGKMKFEDITKKGIGAQAAEGWHTGVTMADVNNDGFLDIYVSRGGKESFGKLRSNLLYINQGNNTFKEESERYGVNSSRSTNQSAFFDMDNDGDPDLYVMNRPYPPIERTAEVDLYSYPYSDQLFENQSGVYVDISDKAGIQNYAFGLGIAISDLNGDGYQDIYVSNDYIGQDYMYINQHNNTFKEEIKLHTKHISYNGMGNDIADFNNDGFVDIMTVDMAIEDHIKSKKSMSGMSLEDFWKSVQYGHQLEYMFNTLQLNNGNGTFSDVAIALGVSKTDWSWGPLFADFDNDGHKDLFITNGFKREMRDNDLLIRLSTMTFDASDYEEILGMAAETKVPNYFFKNTGEFGFEKVATEWKMDQRINSNGAAYADLDNDGDLDLVVNNMEVESSIFENKLKSDNHYLRVKLIDKYHGATVTARAGGNIYYQESYTTRGFQSCMEDVIHFGLGKNEKIDELIITYSDGKENRMVDVEVDQVILIRSKDASKPKTEVIAQATMFTEEKIVEHLHVEFIMNDFAREVLLPHKMSQLGPFMSKGDVSGDGLEDFYISGSRKYPGAMYLQTAEGGFNKVTGPWERQRDREELGSVMFDADGDGDLDLYIVNGSNEYTFYTANVEQNEINKKLIDQLYINDGKGHFENETLERMPQPGPVFSGQDVKAVDYDNDGDMDLFVPGRQIPGYYPYTPAAFLYRNDGGKFYRETRSADLEFPGMITESLFDDFDKDGDLDLICVGEWMPIMIFENRENIFVNVTENYGLSKTVGWWMSISKGDFNEDGINDYVVGNIGENNKFHPSEEAPLEIFVNDFDKSGTKDIVLGKYQTGMCYPVRGRECTSQQMPFILQKFPTYSDFANSNLEGIYGAGMLDSALHFSATEFSSSVLLSSNGGYKLQHLPIYAQLGPLNATQVADFNHDGHLDILGVGNNYGAEVETERYDAGRGVLLLGDGQGNFKALPPTESGFFVNSDAKDMILIKNLIIVSSNSDSLKFFRWK